MKVKLTHRQLDDLQEAADMASMTLRENYSGRYMYGKTCVGVAGAVGDLVSFILSVVDANRELANELEHMNVDNMGTDMIFYWTHLQAPQQDPGETMGDVLADGTHRFSKFTGEE
jgi:hypothetical protein